MPHRHEIEGASFQDDAPSFTTVLLQLGLLRAREWMQSLSYLIEIKRRKVVGLGRFELPTHGLGNLETLLTGYENFRL